MTIDADQTVAEAVEVMRKYDIEHIPVTNAESLIGSLSESGLFQKIFSNPEIKSATIRSVIEPPYPVASFEHLHGKVVGMPYQLTMHPDDTKICEEVAAKCFANPNQMFPATIRKHDGKGGYVITQWEYKAMFTDNNEPKGVFCLGYDITKFVAEQMQLKEAETEIEKKSDILNKIAF